MLYFSTPFVYAPNASHTWDWLHCSYPQGKQGPMTMHSYVFNNSHFLGQGFKISKIVQAGGLSCRARFPAQALMVHEHLAIAQTNLFLFGWKECSCTDDAEERFASASLCYEKHVWSQREERMMAYLQCHVSNYQDHSFVFFKMNGKWSFQGNGFRFAAGAMSSKGFAGLIKRSGSNTTCTSNQTLS